MAIMLISTGRSTSVIAFMPWIHADITAVSALPNITRGGMRFSKRAIDQVAAANRSVDTFQYRDPVAHCTEELLAECTGRLMNYKTQIINALSGPGRNGSNARILLGFALHLLQDFYAHSNWVNNPGLQHTGHANELGRSLFQQQPGLRMCEDDKTTITASGLVHVTTGYYDVAPPPGKCIHGGNPYGGNGIHKDTTFRAFHTEARIAATLGSIDFVNQILDAPGITGNTAAIREFMGVTGVVGIVFDRTHSMEPWLPTYKAIANYYIDRAELAAEAPVGYMLQTFDDPTIDPPILYSSAAALKSAIASLTVDPVDNPDCPEPSFSALASAVRAAPIGSRLVVVTDASSKDAGLAPSIRAEVDKKGIEVLFYAPWSCSPVDPEYVETARTSGGIVVSGDPNGESVVTRVGDQLAETLSRDSATLLLEDHELSSSQEKTIDIPIDSTVASGSVSVTLDNLSSVRLLRPTGIEAVATDQDVAMSSFPQGWTAAVRVPQPGLWRLVITGSGHLTISASATTSLALADVSFVTAGTADSHGALVPRSDRPLVGETATAVAAISGVTTNLSFQHRMLSGTLIGPLALHADEVVGGNEFIGDLIVPSQPYRITATGKDALGYDFVRVWPEVLRGSTVRLQPTGATKLLVPNRNVDVEFTVTNFGAPATFGLTATDENGLALLGTSPQTVGLASGQTSVRTFTIAVPLNTTLTSTALTVNATKDGLPDVINSSTSYFTIGPPQVSIEFVAPRANDTLTVGQVVTLTPDVRSSDPVQLVQYFSSRSGPIGSSLTPPYTVTWTPQLTGNHDLTATVHTTFGGTVTSSAVPVAVVPAPDTVQVAVDAPTSGANFVKGSGFPITGWAADLSAASPPGISSVHVWALPVNGTPGDPAFLGIATYGLERPDVVTAYARPDLLYSGFGLTAGTSLAVGSYDIRVSAFSTASQTPTERLVRINVFEPRVSFSAVSSSVVEGAGTVSAIVTLTTDAPLPSAVTVNYATADGGATAGADYTATSGTLTFGAGSANGATRSISVAIVDDTVYEASPQTLSLSLSGASGGVTVSPSTHVVTIVEDDLAPASQVILDTPGEGTVHPSAVVIGGWAIDTSAPSGTGVTQVDVYAYRDGQEIFLGTAPYGSSRSDVGSLYGSRFAPSGYAIGPTLPGAGSYTLKAKAYDSYAGVWVWSNERHITVSPMPRMWVDTPTDGTVPSTFVVQGWAIDCAAGSGTGVDYVHVWAYPNPGSNEPASFLGQATYGYGRPDVASGYGNQFYSSGYSLTTSPALQAGVYQIVVFAHSTVTSSWSQSMSRYVTVLTGVHSAIDTPAVDATVGSSFGVTGWAFDASSTSGNGVPVLHAYVYLNGVTPQGPIEVVPVADSRPDIGAWLQHSRFSSSGWGFTLSNLPAGTHLLVIYPYSSLTGFGTPMLRSITVQ